MIGMGMLWADESSLKVVEGLVDDQGMDGGGVMGEGVGVGRAGSYGWRRWLTCAALAVIAGVAVLRLPAVYQRALWIDETYTLRDADRGALTLMTWSYRGGHPPLSFLLVNCARWLAGRDAEWVLRLPSVLAWLGCVPAAYWVGRRIHSHAAGLCLSLLIVLGPEMAAEGSQARMYSLGMLFTLLTGGWAHRLMTGSTRPLWAWAVFGALLAGGFWSSAMGMLVNAAALSAVVMWLALEQLQRVAPRPGGRRWLGLACTLVVAATLASPGLARQWARLHAKPPAAGDPNHIAYRAELGDALGTLLQTADKIVHMPCLPQARFLDDLLLWLGAMGLMWMLLRRSAAGLVWGSIAMCNAIGLAYMLTRHHALEPRYLLPAWFALWLGMFVIALDLRPPRMQGSRAAGIAGGPTRATTAPRIKMGSDPFLIVRAAGIAALLMILTMASVQWEHRHDEVGQVLRDLRVTLEPGDVVLISPDWMNHLQQYYVPQTQSPTVYDLVAGRCSGPDAASTTLPHRVILVGAYIYDDPANAMLVQWKQNYEAMARWLGDRYTHAQPIGPYDDDRCRAITFTAPSNPMAPRHAGG